MGHLFYGSSGDPITMPDRLLAHVKVVIATKLRRGESFTLSWIHADGESAGRSTVWLHPSIELRFVFSTAEAEALDKDLLQGFATAANSTAGLVIDVAAHAEAPVRELQAA